MAVSSQIVELHKQGLSVDDIVEVIGNGLKPEMVRYELARVGASNGEDISESDIRAIFKRLKNIALTSENEQVATKAGAFLIEQSRGSAKLRGAPQINLTQINQVIREGIESAEELARNAFKELDTPAPAPNGEKKT